MAGSHTVHLDSSKAYTIPYYFRIRAWEWVDAVDAPRGTKTPYLFYELKRESNRWLKDTVFGGLPYKNYDSVPILPEDPLPVRLAGLRRLMNTEGRELASAYYD